MNISDLILVFIGFTGFVLAFYIYTKKHTKQPLVCPLRTSCESVVHSDYSRFMGIPVEKLGMAYYAFVAIVHGVFLALSHTPSPEFLLVSLVVSFTAFLFSAYLISIQAFVLRQWCTWCIFSAILCVLIFLITFITLPMSLIPVLVAYKKLLVVLHLLGMALGVGAATITDIFFFKFLRNYKITEPEADIMKTLSHVIWFALGLLVVSGLGLYLPESNFLNDSSKFIVKIIGVAVLIVNGFFLNVLIQPRLVHISFNEPHPHRPGELHVLRKLSFALGAISISSWYFVFVLGALRRIKVEFLDLFLGYVLLLLGAVICSQIFEHFFIKKNNTTV